MLLVTSTLWIWAALATAQAPTFAPPDRYSLSENEAAAIAAEFDRLTNKLAERRSSLTPERYLDLAVVVKAVEWANRHRDYFVKRDAESALALLKIANAELAQDLQRTSSASGWRAHGYRSRVDGSIQPYLVYVPDGYDVKESVRYRLDVVLHGRNEKLSEVNFLCNPRRNADAEKQTKGLTLHVFGRTNNAYRWAGESDVFEAIAATKSRYRVDERRIVLRGFSMGGAGAWHLGLHHPDVWRSVEAGAGFSETKNYTKMTSVDPLRARLLHIYDAADYALNAVNVPMAGYGGEDDPQLRASENIVQALGDLGFTLSRNGLLTRCEEIGFLRVVGAKMGHKVDPPSAEILRAFHDANLDKPKPKAPERVRFVTYTLKWPEAGGLRIEGLTEHYQRAEMDATTKADRCEIATRNIEAIRIADRPGRTIRLDGQEFAATQDEPRRFRRDGRTWRTSSPAELDDEIRKRPGLQGPIDDAFAGPFLCVRGTGKPWSADVQRWADERLSTFERDWDRFLRGRIRIKNDVDVTEEDIRDSHLIAFGDPGSNSILAKLRDRSPCRWTESETGFAASAVADSRSHAPIFIIPNPLNPQRYLVVNSGHTFGAKEFQGTNALLYPRLGDFAVVRIKDGAIAESGVFDERWRLRR